MQKIVMPVGGGIFYVDLLVQYCGLGALLIFGKLRLSALRVVLYVLTFGTAVVLQISFIHDASYTSMLLAMAIYATYIGVVPASRETYMRILTNFQLTSIAVCVLVYLDMILQVVGVGMPDMNKVVPAALLDHSMVYLQPIVYGSSINKPNAFFFLEASVTSQFVALGLIIELAFFRRLTVIIAMTVGVLLTFSGTGIVLVMTSLPIIGRKHWRQMLISGVIGLPILAGVASATGWVDIVENRLNSSSREHSSFSERFVLPYTAMWDLAANGSEKDILAGLGAGATMRITENAEYNAIPRAFLEYGLIFCVLFAIYTTYCFFGTGVPFICGWLAFIHYNFLAGNFHLSSAVNFAFVLAGGYAIETFTPHRQGRFVPASAAAFDRDF